MSSQKFWILKPWLVLGAFLIAWWILPIIIKSFTQVGLYELQAPLSKASGKITDLQEYWTLRNHSKKELVQVIRDLARLNASYELSISENIALKEELGRLEKLLDLPKLPEYQHILARVIRRDLSSWSHQIIIHKGQKDGIINGAAVIYDKGVVGRVKETFAHTSVVELASSPSFRVAAKFENDNRPITYQGISNPGFMDPIGESSNIPTDITAPKDTPLRLVSSKLGGVFPDGLTIGIIKNLKPGTDGIFNCAKVYLDPSLHAIGEVAVLLPLNRTINNEQ